MKKILLLQLPISKVNFGMRCGNIPMGAATLKTSYELNGTNCKIDILDEKISSYTGDSALINEIYSIKPDIIGFTVFSWNLARSLYIAEILKKKFDPEIIFGGPEITEDNQLIKSDYVDFYVFGEGEGQFAEIIDEKIELTPNFEDSPDPYIKGLIDYSINGTMLLETMRGCPYTCGYCYYNKSQKKLSFRNCNRIIESIRWAIDNEIEELYLLDPSINVRPDLKDLLKKISEVNKNKSVMINSEIRADKISEEEADLFFRAGFNGFETGLQTTNEKALKIMKRKTDLNRFVAGINFLKERDIVPRIDLILGLPGDSYEGFQDSVLFINEHEMNDDIQVFPLSVLPGTDFRKNSNALGLKYENEPPYTVISTNTFSKDEMLLAIDNTETLFDMALFPLPDLNLSLDKKRFDSDVQIEINNNNYITKLVFNSYRSLDEVKEKSEILTNPYQLIFSENIKKIDFIYDVVSAVSENNPYVPFEIVFFNPVYEVNTDFLLKHVNLVRPQFLDNDLRLQYNKEGNRSVLFTVVSKDDNVWFLGEMKRQIYWWTDESLPDRDTLKKYEEFEGIFFDRDHVNPDWLSEMAEYLDDNFFVSFLNHWDQKDFLIKTSDDYYFDILPQ